MHPWKISLVYLLFFSSMIFVNYSVGSQVGQVANQDPALIQPSGYAFSIWGLIYLLLFVWILRGFYAYGQKADLYRELRYMLPLNVDYHLHPADDPVIGKHYYFIIAFTSGDLSKGTPT